MRVRHKSRRQTRFHCRTSGSVHLDLWLEIAKHIDCASAGRSVRHWSYLQQIWGNCRLARCDAQSQMNDYCNQITLYQAATFGPFCWRNIRTPLCSWTFEIQRSGTTVSWKQSTTRRTFGIIDSDGFSGLWTACSCREQWDWAFPSNVRKPLKCLCQSNKTLCNVLYRSCVEAFLLTRSKISEHPKAKRTWLSFTMRERQFEAICAARKAVGLWCRSMWSRSTLFTSRVR